MDADRDAVVREFTDSVNMPPKVLDRWLETDESRSVGIVED